MDVDFLIALWNAPSLITFLDEIIILLGIQLVNVIKKKKRFSAIPPAFFDGMHSILLVIMPSIVFFSVLTEAHFPVHVSVLLFMLVFVGWYVRLFMKYEKIPKVITGMFIGLLLFIIPVYAVLYSIFR